MTGLDRLRGYARRMDELHVWPGGAKLLDIADQIERERNVCDREEHEAASWVREHGGLDAVRSEWSSRVPYDKHEQRRQRLLGHIAECETALGRRNQRIKELGRRVSDLTRENAELRRMFQDADNRRVELCAALDIDLDKGWSDAMAAMRLRLMPEGVEWPRFEDDKQVQFLDDFERYGNESCVGAVTMYPDGSFALNCRAYSKGERVNRPAPEADAWERIEEDAGMPPSFYCVGHMLYGGEEEGSTTSTSELFARDLVRRCRALAERGE